MRLGTALFLFMLTLLVSSSAGLIFTGSQNVPVALAEKDLVYPTATAIAARQVGGGDEDVDVAVFGVAITDEDEASIDLGDVDGVLLGDWRIKEKPTPVVYVLSETVDGTRLTVVTGEGFTRKSVLLEEAMEGGRLFRFGNEAPSDYLILGDDGSLSFGGIAGIWQTVAARD